MVLIEKDSLYRRTEGLLRDYRAMKARIEILEAELVNMGFETGDEAIEGYYFSRTISNMPHGTELSDKTSRVALEWQERYRKEFSKVWNMFVLDKENKKNELTAVRQMLKMIDIAIGSLLQDDRKIITYFYIDGLQWVEISSEMQYSVRHCKRIRNRGVWYITKSMMGKWKVY